MNTVIRTLTIGLVLATLCLGCSYKPRPTPTEVVVTLSPTAVEIKSGETETVTAKVKRDGYPKAKVMVEFTTEDETVATASPSSAQTNEDGEAQATVTGVSPGSTKVTATAKGKSASADVTVVADPGPPPPTVTSIDPNNGNQGQTLAVTINGANFQNGASSDFGAGITVVSTNFVSSTLLRANITIAWAAGLGSRTVTVTNPDGQSGSRANAFTMGEVPSQRPTVVAANPNNGIRGQTLAVTINGANFQNGASSDFGAGITVVSTNFVSSTRLRANITIAGAAAPGSRTVTVTNPDGQSGSIANAFEAFEVKVVVVEEERDPRLPPSAFLALDSILEALPPGNIAFNVPSEMLLDNSYAIHLLLSPSMSVEEIKRTLRERVGAEVTLEGVDVKIAEEAEVTLEGVEVKIAEEMEARLTGQNFSIIAIKPESQPVTWKEPTEWQWDVSPLKRGTHTLHLTLNAVLRVNNSERRRPIQTFNRSIQVKVTFFQRVSGFIGENWEWLWAAIIVPIVGWLWKRRRKKISTINNVK